MTLVTRIRALEKGYSADLGISLFLIIELFSRLNAYAKVEKYLNRITSENIKPKIAPHVSPSSR